MALTFRGDGGHLARSAAAAGGVNATTPYKIFIHIIEARGLISGDENHMSDALCILELGPTLGERRSTTTQHKTMNAVWDQVFMFDDVMLANHEFQAEKISLSVLHKSDFVRNKLIGSYEFSLGNIYRQRGHQYYRQWVPLTVPEKPENEEGYLQVTVYVLGPNDPTPVHEAIPPSLMFDDNAQVLSVPNLGGDKKMYTLNVLIYRGADVLTTQYGGKGSLDAAGHEAKDIGVSPFVSVRFNGNILQTNAIPSDSADRTWDRCLQMPFTLPLRSDSIEVIMWNKRVLLSDEIIGVKTFNFFQMGLSHRAWGPRWVNMYASNYQSPQTTLLGKIKHYWINEKTLNKHEYVGRILMRLSVTPTEDPRLLIIPAAKATDPNSDDFTLQMLLHSASELPIMGGKVCVELVFGVHRVRSKWAFSKANHPGVFEFFDKFPPISSHIPMDSSQAHHVFLNVYQKVGANVSKVAYEKIPLASLLPNGQNGFFHLNGDTRIARTTKLASWPCKWRTLQHVHPDKGKSHVVAGFLLASIGFGLKRDYPPTENIPPPAPDKLEKFTLRCYVHQAANLLAALPNGCSNPVLAVRYSGRSLLLPCQQKNTLFPLWFEVHELSGVVLDLIHAPSVHLMLLHQTTFGNYVSLGRAEVATEHILANPRMLCRYRVRYDQDASEGAGGNVPGASPPGANQHAVDAKGFPVINGAVNKQKNLSDYLLSANASRGDDFEPYVLASFELFPTRDSRHHPRDPAFPPATRDFVVKLEAIGLRELAGTLQDPGLQPELEIAVPKLSFGDDATITTGMATTKGKTLLTGDESTNTSDGTREADVLPGRPVIKWEKQTPACSRPKGQGIQVLNAATFTRVALPVTDPYSFPLRIRVLNAASSHPKECFASRFIPVSELLDMPLHLPRPPTYRYTDASAQKRASLGDALGAGSMQSGGVIGGGGGASSIVEEDDDAEMLLARAGTTGTQKVTKQLAAEINDIPREYEGLIMHVEDDTAHGDLALADLEAASSSSDRAIVATAEDPLTLELDPLAMNVGPGTSSEEVRVVNVREWRADGPVKEGESKEDEVSDEVPLDDDGPQRPKLRMLSLFRNIRTAWVVGPSNIVEACVLKAYVRCRALPSNQREADRVLYELERDNLIQSLKPLYERGYMARVYIYTGINLAPLANLFENHQSSNPYLVASNGTGPLQRVSYAAKAKQDDLNPEFFQVFDLSTRVPDNYKLEVQVWNKGYLRDDLIGSVWIDLETRLLQQAEGQRLAALGEGTEFNPTTEYHDLKNEAARTSQGKLSMKLEMLTEEEARRTKPDDIAPAVSQEYELRMVIFSTQEVRFPVDADADGAPDDVNQRVTVTTNFGHVVGREVQKQTDVAWNSAGGSADWFYRMKWRLKLPCKLPRVKIAMWNETVMTDNLLIGECLYNLTPFFAQCMRDPKDAAQTEQIFVPFVHPQFPGRDLGEVNVQFWLLTETEADKNPVGEAQDEPNRDPFLRDPKRNPPPWAFGTKGLIALGKWKRLIMAIAFAVVLCAVAVGLIVPIVAIA